MKYKIYRTSDWIGEKPPCKDAYIDKTPHSGETLWVIDIDNLKQLDDLVSEVGDIIISKDQKVNQIEIYDYYRE